MAAPNVPVHGWKIIETAMFSEHKKLHVKYITSKKSMDDHDHFHRYFNPLPVQFKTLLHGQKGCVFFSGHLNLRTTPETGLPSREKNHYN
jgi:hypothetical protein